MIRSLMESFYNDEAGVVLKYSFGESDMKLLEQHFNTERVSLYFEGLEVPDLDFLAPCKSLEAVGAENNQNAPLQIPIKRHLQGCVFFCRDLPFCAVCCEKYFGQNPSTAAYII